MWFFVLSDGIERGCTLSACCGRCDVMNHLDKKQCYCSSQVIQPFFSLFVTVIGCSCAPWYSLPCCLKRSQQAQISPAFARPKAQTWWITALNPTSWVELSLEPEKNPTLYAMVFKVIRCCMFCWSAGPKISLKKSSSPTKGFFGQSNIIL